MIGKISTFFNEDLFFRSTALVFLTSFFVNLLNYIFTIFTARMLTVESYGELTSLLSLLLIFGVPAGGLGFHTVREVAEKYHDREKLDSFKSKNFQELLVLSFVSWVSFLLLIPTISSLLKLPTYHLLVFSLMLPLSIVSAYHGSFFQGAHKFYESSKLSLVLTCAKLGLSVLFLYLGFSILGVLMALILAYFFNWLIEREAFVGFVAMLTNWKKINLQDLSTHFVSTTFFSMLLITILSNIDVLLSKYFLSSYEAGSYGALSTLGKIVIFATGSLITVMFPLVAKDQNDKTFFKTFLAMSGGGALIVLFFFLFPSELVHTLFGKKYEAITSYVPLFALAMFFVSLSTALVNYFLAIKNKSFIYFLGIGIFAEIIILCYNHKSINEIVNSILYTSIILLVLLLVNYIYAKSLNNSSGIQ